MVNPQDVLWEQTPLSNEPDLFPVCYSTLPIPDWIIDLLVIAIHYSYFGLLLLSLGATNGLFETWILASFLIYCDSPFANPTGLVLQRINELTTFLPLKELVLPFFSWQLPAQSLQQILYHRTLPFLKVNFQIILAFIASICLSTYIRRYLASKSHIHKHYALANYLR